MRGFCLLFCLSMPACAGSSPANQVLEQRERGTAGWLDFVVRSNDEVKQGRNAFQLDLSPREGVLPATAQLSATVTMPAHHHSSSTAPVFEAQGNGHYLVDEVVFSMSGDWEVTYHVAAGTQSDDATFHYEVP